MSKPAHTRSFINKIPHRQNLFLSCVRLGFCSFGVSSVRAFVYLAICSYELLFTLSPQNFSYSSQVCVLDQVVSVKYLHSLFLVIYSRPRFENREGYIYIFAKYVLRGIYLPHTFSFWLYYKKSQDFQRSTTSYNLLCKLPLKIS